MLGSIYIRDGQDSLGIAHDFDQVRDDARPGEV